MDLLGCRLFILPLTSKILTGNYCLDDVPFGWGWALFLEVIHEGQHLDAPLD